MGFKTRFTLRRLILVVTLSALPFAWLGYHIQRNRSRFVALRKFQDSPCSTAVLISKHHSGHGLPEMVGSWLGEPTVFSVRDAEFDTQRSGDSGEDPIESVSLLDHFDELECVAFRGRVTNDWIAPLEGKRQLSVLHLSGDAPMERLDSVGELTSLKSLQLQNVVFDSSMGRVLSELDQLEHLSVFELHGFSLDRPKDCLVGVGQLRDLALDTSSVRLLSMSSPMPAIRRVWIRESFTSVHAISDLGWLKNFPNLEALYMINADGLQPKEFENLRHVPRLSSLTLGGCDVDDRTVTVIAEHVRLRILEMNDTAISDRSLHKIAGMRSLRVLDVQNTAVTDDGLKGLERLNQLQILNVTNTDVTRAAKIAFSFLHPECQIRVQPQQHFYSFGSRMPAY